VPRSRVRRTRQVAILRKKGGQNAGYNLDGVIDLRCTLRRVEHGKDATRELYLTYKGKPMSEGKLWEHVIADEFAEFRKAGLTHPMMADIEKELGISR
jgi:hypothetical protein